MTVSKENFRKAMLFGLMVRRVCEAGKENKLYLFDCPLCGGDAMAIKTKRSIQENVSTVECIHKNRASVRLSQIRNPHIL